MKLQWLKDIIGDVYTDDMDNAAAQALGKDFVSRADFNEKAGKVKELEATVTQLNGKVKDRDKQLETLKASTGDMAALKDQISKLQQDNADAAKAHAAEIKRLKIDTAVATAKAKNVKAVKALLDLDKAELDEDGTVKGLAEQLKKLTTASDSAFMFETEKQQQKFDGFKPGEKGDEPNGGMTLESFRKLSPVERFNFSLKNPEEYKKLYGGTN